VIVDSPSDPRLKATQAARQTANWQYGLKKGAQPGGPRGVPTVLGQFGACFHRNA
jgi:hypothetical protein